MSNWGRNVSNRALNRAEPCYDICLIALTFQERIQKVFDDARAGLEAKEEIIRAMYEQTYDVRADLNNALIMFCQVSFTVQRRFLSQALQPVAPRLWFESCSAIWFNSSSLGQNGHYFADDIFIFSCLPPPSPLPRPPKRGILGKIKWCMNNPASTNFKTVSHENNL